MTEFLPPARHPIITSKSEYLTDISVFSDDDDVPAPGPALRMRPWARAVAVWASVQPLALARAKGGCGGRGRGATLFSWVAILSGSGGHGSGLLWIMLGLTFWWGSDVRPEPHVTFNTVCVATSSELVYWKNCKQVFQRLEMGWRWQNELPHIIVQCEKSGMVVLSLLLNKNLMSDKVLLFLPQSISHNLCLRGCCIMYKWTMVCEIFCPGAKNFCLPGIRMGTGPKVFLGYNPTLLTRIRGNERRRAITRHFRMISLR